LKILALDFGEKKIGTAIADSEIKVALTREILLNNSQLFTKLKKICQTEKIAKIILGLPRGFTKETKQTHIIREFAKELQAKLNLPVKFFDEIFSTKIATKNLQRTKNLDSEAARIFLQDALEIMNFE
jgi:putative holliday junction resolvase